MAVTSIIQNLPVKVGKYKSTTITVSHVGGRHLLTAHNQCYSTNESIQTEQTQVGEEVT